jgi:cell wall-associated NlpC family hydrolase
MPQFGKRVFLVTFFSALCLFHSVAMNHTDSLKVDSCATIFDDFYQSSIAFAKSKLGIKYGRNGYDCSGLVMKAFKSVGVELPHSSAMQSKLGDKVTKANAAPGDLIFFSSGRSGKGKVGHVGIVVEVLDNSVKFIHSAIKGGVKFDYLSQDYYRKHFMFIKRNSFIINK